METRIEVQSEEANARLVAEASLVSAVSYQLLLFVALLVRPELDSSWQPISEYAIGRLGWVTILAFLLSATSYMLLFLAVRKQAGARPGRIGLGLLLVCVVGTVGAGVFISDPIQTPQNDLSPTGSVHAFSAGASLLLLPFAAVCINISLARNRLWRPKRRLLVMTAGLPMLGLLGFVIAMAMIAPIGDANMPQYGPGVNIGWPNRVVLLIYTTWTVALAWQLSRLGSSPDT